MRSDTRLELVQLLELIETKLELLPPLTMEHRPVRRQAIEELQAHLEQEEGASFREVGTSTVMRLAGTQSSSVIDAVGAMRNWCFAVRRRIGFGAEQ